MFPETLTRRSRSFVGALLAASLASVFAAESASPELAELSLDSLLDMPVTGASRFVQRRSQAASIVTVVTREEIQALGHRTLADVLRSVRGVVVTTDRTYDYLGVRGFLSAGDYNTRVLLLVDGNRVNDALYDQAFLGSEFPLDLDLVERVEFVPGQGSAVYGANALFGVVNVITRESARSAQALGSASWGTQGQFGVQAQLRLPWGRGGIQLQASRQLRRGEDVVDPAMVGVGGSDGRSRGTDGMQRTALAIRADQGPVTFSFIHADRTKGVPLALDLIFGDARNRYRDTTTLLNLEGQFALDADTKIQARAFAGRYRFIGDYAVDYPPPTLNRDLVVAEWAGVETRGTLVRGDHRIAAGIELQRMPTLLQQNFDLEPNAMSYLDDLRSSWRAAVYFEDQWTFDPHWTVHLGGRIDRVARHANETSPRLAVVWAMNERTSFKLIHGSAFRPPNAYEAYYAIDAPAGYVRNPDLKSERVRGTELVGEWRPDPVWRLSGSLYSTRAERLLLLGYDAAIDRYGFTNSGTLSSQGGELEAETLQTACRCRVNYSWNHVSGPSADQSAFPRQMLKGTAIWSIGADRTLALEALGIGRRGGAAGYGLFNLTLRGKPIEGGPDATFTIRNLADRQFVDPGADPVRQPTLPLPRREMRLELRWTFAQ